MFINVLSFKLRGLHGYLRLAGAFKPQFHVQCQFAVRPVIDDLPHYKSMPPQFRGSEETVDW